MKKLLFAVALAVVATACHNNEEGILSAQEGKIAINASTRGEVGKSGANESGVFVLENTPKAEELKVEIVGNDQTLTWDTLAAYDKEVENGMLFTSAPYTVTLSHGEKGAKGWSKPYFEGSASVSVPGYGLTVEANVEVVLRNSIIAIETTEQFDGYFPKSSFKVEGIEWDATKKELLFLNAGEVTINCTAIRQTGTTTELQSKVTLKPTTRHTVVFDLSTAGNATVSVVFDDEIVETIELEVELNQNA